MERSREDLSSLLSLEKELRFAAEAEAEAQKQALLQVLAYLSDKLEPPPEPSGEEPQRYTRRASSSSSVGNFPPPLPRAFSREFYDAVLQDMPGEVQETLAALQQKDTSTSDSSSFDKACAAIKLDNYKQLVTILQDNTESSSRSRSDNEREALLQYGTQLLHLAVEERSINCVQVLLKGGVSPNESGLSSLPPLHTAANNGFKSCIKVLLQYGAEVDLQDSKGQTPLYLALVAGHTDCVQLLLKSHSPCLSLLTAGGRSLLHAAVSSCLDNELRLLLVSIRASLPPESVSSILNGQEFSSGYTALHIAAEKKHMKCLMVLLSIPEVNPNLMSFDGRTALDLVTDSPDCIALLSTKIHKEASVIVHDGHSVSSSTSSGGYVIGRIKVLTHHNWDDLKWLVRSCFKEFQYSQKYNERFENKFSESHTYLNHKRLIGTSDEDLNQLCQTDSLTLLQEMKDVLSKRCSSFKPLNDLSSAMKDIKIGQYAWSTNGRGSERCGSEGRSPYEAIAQLEESGDLLEIIVHLENGYQRISYTSLIPQDVLEKYTNQLLKSKCVIIHGPPEVDLNQISGHIAASLKSVTTAKIDKIHIPLRPNYSRSHLVSLLYDYGILIPCSESAETTSDLPHCSLLVIEGVDKIQFHDVLYTLYSLLEHYSTGESIYLDLNNNNNDDEQSSVPTGNYTLSEQCYIIATRTLFTKTGSGLPREVMDSYAHIWLCDCEEPILGQLYRTYFKELVHANKGNLPLKSDYVYQAVVWVWQFWLIYNHFIQQLGLHELTLGVKLFLNCPVLSNNADSIYNWFAELWSFHVLPKLKEHLLTRNQQKKQEATYKSLIFFIIHRLISSTCPLPPQALNDFLSALYSFSDNELLFVPPGQSTVDKSVSRDTRSPKIKRTYSKKSISSTELTKTNQWVSVAAAVKSIEDLSASTGDLNKSQRPKSGSFFSKNSTLRRSLFKGSRASLYALEEEDGKGSEKSSSGKLKRKKKKELDQEKKKELEQEKKESMDELFDVLMSSDELRMDDQRVTKVHPPPHHVISVQSSTGTPPASHSPSHSLSDKFDSIRPLSAEGNTSPVAKLSSDQSLNKIRQTRHPRISNLLEAHSLPQVLSRSDENVYHTVSMVSPSSDSPRPFSASTAPYHPRQVSTASSGYSDSRRSSTDSLSNSFNSDLMRNTSYNSASEFKRTSSLDGIIDDISGHTVDTSGHTDVKTTNGNGVSSSTSGSNGAVESSSVDASNKEASNGLPVVVSPRTRRFSRSYQALYSASLGACASDVLQKSRKLSLPAKVGSSTFQSPKKPHNQRMSTSLMNWRLEESVVEM